eukprot:Skav207523  [mRNA]  locus=scaffold907:263229:301472:+ [translate_table: standard]
MLGYPSNGYSYGAAPGFEAKSSVNKSPFGRSQRRSINLPALALCLVLPWLIFTSVYSLCSLSIHYQNAQLVLCGEAAAVAVVLVVAYSALQNLRRKTVETNRKLCVFDRTEGETGVPKRVVSKEGGVCWQDALDVSTCCSLTPWLQDADGYCPLFCKEGTEIDTHNAKGWEDEQCKTISHAKGESGDPTYIGNAICFRSAGSLDGTCRFLDKKWNSCEDVRQLVILLHERRMKVIVDVNMNHAGSQKVNASNPRDVSILKPFNKPEHYHSDNCSLIHDADYERGAYFLEHCKLYGLPDFNHENPIVWQGLMQWVRDHVDKYGFDGIRVDAARHINRRLCPDSPQYCPRVIDDQVNLTALQRHSLTAGSFKKDSWWYGVYHMLISALPSIAPRLDKLRNGTMQVFLHAGHRFVGQILLLDLNVWLRGKSEHPLGMEAFSFCAPEIHFDLSTRPQYPRFEFSVPDLALFRRNLLASDDWMDENRRFWKPTMCRMWVLSRGHSARALGNEDEMVQALKTLGRPVEAVVVTPDPENFLHTLQTLSRAEVLVGAHGANMANMLFAPDGMKVVEIVPQASRGARVLKRVGLLDCQVPFKMQDYHFWDLAAALNFTYLPIGDKAAGPSVMPNEYDHQLALDLGRVTYLKPILHTFP